MRRLRTSGAAVVVLAALALALAASVAEAAPALSASENPVVILFNQSSKTITLNWNLVDAAWGNLTVTDDTNTTILSQTLIAPPASGSVPLMVTYPRTYTATLVDLFNPANQATLVITTKRPSLNGNPGLSICFPLCITSLDIEPHGTRTTFDVKTSRPARFSVLASTSPPGADGSFAHVDGLAGTLGHHTGQTLKMLLLEPNTTYHYVLTATDEDGNTTSKAGTFKTLRRRVEVKFDRIKVTDDADELTASDCECTFWFQVGNLPPEDYGEVSVGSGSSVYPHVTLAYLNAPDTLKLRVEGIDRDVDFGEFCPYGTLPSWTNGTNSCYEWATAETTIWVTPDGPLNEVYVGSFQMTANGELAFTVYGTYTVTYVP